MQMPANTLSELSFALFDFSQDQKTQIKAHNNY